MMTVVRNLRICLAPNRRTYLRDKLMSEQKPDSPHRLPPWAKVFAVFGTLIVIGTGLAVAFVPGWEIRHARALVGLELPGVTAIVVGLGIVLWGGIFMLLVLYPDHWIWTRRKKPSAGNSQESTHDADTSRDAQPPDTD